MKIQKTGSVFALIIVIIIAALSIIDCNGRKSSQNNMTDKTGDTGNISVDVDYSGIYKLTDDRICDIVIAIIKDDGGYEYSITGKAVKDSGRLSVVKDGSVAYLSFTRTKRSGDKEVVEGLYDNGSIIIQNYGNAINQYVCFEQCDAKFLEFIKEQPSK